jgi:hypothetical protein
MRSRWIGFLLLAIALIGGALVQAGHPIASAATLSKVYWSDQSGQKLSRGDLDSTNLTDLVSSPAPASVAVDHAAGKVYWTNWVSSVSSEPSTIQRSNLDGSGIETVLTLTDHPKSLVGLALDPAAGHMYFMAGWNGEWNGELRRANMSDGSNMVTLVSGLGDPRGVTLDGAGKMYFSDAKADAIERANLDGTNREYLLTGLTGPFGIALDLPGNHIFWTDTSLGAVHRANLDGTGIITLISDPGQVAPGIDLDLSVGKLYWAQFGRIRRANTDGTDVADVITGIGNPSGIALDLHTYSFSGFYAPVDNMPIVNSVKAGAAVPVKFSLGGDQGLNILAAGYPRSQVIACTLTEPVDAIEETVAAGGSSLTYDPVTDRYSYVWKTDKAWASQCRQLVVMLNDGMAHRANFKFK